MSTLKIKLENLQCTLTDPVSDEDINIAWHMVGEIISEVAQLEEALTEQLGKRGYAFRGRCDYVPEDIERAFNALGICTEEHKAILEEKR